jgi:hypothetical protein
MRARRTPTLAELPDIESRSRRDRRPVRRARRSRSKSWSIRQVSDERLARAVWATGRPFAAPQPELESHCIRVMPNISNLVAFGESANLTGLSPERETRRNRGSLRGRRLSIGGRVGEPGRRPSGRYRGHHRRVPSQPLFQPPLVCGLPPPVSPGLRVLALARDGCASNSTSYLNPTPRRIRCGAAS